MKKTIAILLPSIPLIEGMFREPYFSPKYMVDDSTLPILQFIMLILLLMFGWGNNKSIKVNLVSTSMLCVTVVYSLITVSELPNLSFAVVFLLAYTLVYLDFDKEEAIKNLNYFIMVFVAVVVAVWAVRLASKGGNLIAARSGANIYGANAVVNILYIGFICNIVYTKYRRDVLWLVALLFISLIFISRTGIVLSLAICGVWSIIYFKDHKKIIGWMYTIAGILGIVFFIAIEDAVEMVLGRFGFVGDGATLIEIATRLYQIQVDMQRGLIWANALELIERYPLFGAGIGEFKYYGAFTSAHNLILNNWAEFGLILGTFLNLLFIYPFFLLLKIKNKRDRYMALFIYFMFLVQAITAGQKLVQSTGYVSSFFIYCVFVLHSVLFTDPTRKIAYSKKTLLYNERS